MERNKVYLSAPVYNEPQSAAEEKMFEVLDGAGFSAFRAARVGFPPEIQQVVNVGWAASGRADTLSSKGKAILLPGEAEQASNAPTGMQLGLPQGAIVAQLLSPPMNITDPNVLVEIGMGVALGKPILCLAVGDVQCGAHVREESVTLMESFESFEDAVKRLSESEELEQTLATLREERSDDLPEPVEEEGNQE